MLMVHYIMLVKKEINFSLQTNRTEDPITGSIALQLNDNPSSIAFDRAVTHDLTLNSIGNIVDEADLISWGNLNYKVAEKSDKY